MNQESSYTFGDGALAARRLALLGTAFAEPTRAFLHEQAGAPVECVELGCGPGHSTRLLHEALGGPRITALERSPEHAARARRELSDLGDVRVIEHDVQKPPFPVAAADLVFARFLLTHLTRPEATLRSWAALARPRGRLLVQELSAIESEHPALARYYELVETLQAHHGQSLRVGRDLSRFDPGPQLALRSWTERRFSRPAATMAELHAMNIATWRRDPVAVATFDSDELHELERRLLDVAAGRDAASPVRLALGELVLLRRGA